VTGTIMKEYSYKNVFETKDDIEVKFSRVLKLNEVEYIP